eukprot:6334411-Karenia_brevis.AAC.1
MPTLRGSPTTNDAVSDFDTESYMSTGIPLTGDDTWTTLRTSSSGAEFPDATIFYPEDAFVGDISTED